MKQLQNKLIIGLILGVAVFVALGLYADFREIGRLLQTFRWVWVPLILVLTAVNYGLRFLKWHYYLHQIGVKDVGVWDDLRIFMGGFGLSLTPGKTGELAKTLWLQNRAGIHPARTAPMVFAERLSDGIAMVILSLLGALLYPQYQAAALTVGAVLVLAVVVVQIRPLALYLLGIGEKLPGVAKIAHRLHELYESACELLQFKNLLVAIGLGLVAWIIEGVAFYLILLGLGLPASTDLFFLATFILAFALVAGGASGMPGGLGVTEGGITGMLQLLGGTEEGLAATATLLIRFCVLWFGVLIGMAIIVGWRQFLLTPVLVAEEA